MNRLMAFVFAIGLLGSSWTAVADMPSVTDAWVREAPPTSTVNAAYMQLSNTSEQDIILVSASSPQYVTVQIHLTKIVEGVAKMLPQLHVHIAANSRVIFEPKGLHLMLIDAKQAIKAGDHVDITLNFADGTSLDIKAAVRSAVHDAAAIDHNHHHH